MPKVVVTGRLVLIFRDFSKLDLMSAVVGRPFLVVVELFFLLPNQRRFAAIRRLHFDTKSSVHFASAWLRIVNGPRTFKTISIIRKLFRHVRQSRLVSGRTAK